MAEVQIAVRLGGKRVRILAGSSAPASCCAAGPGDRTICARVLAGGEIGFDDVTDEVGAGECG
jgi:hypothetical protein